MGGAHHLTIETKHHCYHAMPQIPFHPPFPPLCGWPPQHDTTRPSDGTTEDQLQQIPPFPRHPTLGRELVLKKHKGTGRENAVNNREPLISHTCPTLNQPTSSNASTLLLIWLLEEHLTNFLYHNKESLPLSVPLQNHLRVHPWQKWTFEWISLWAQISFSTKYSDQPNQPWKKNTVCALSHLCLRPRTRLMNPQFVLNHDH